MLFIAAVTTCAFMLPCAPIQSQSAVTRNNAPPQMLDLFGKKKLPTRQGNRRVVASGGGGGGGGDQTAAYTATAAAFAFVIFASTFNIVQPGQVGIVTTLGSMSPTPIQAGFRFKSPLANTETFSIKTTLTEESTTVPTKEGLSIELDTALLYRLEPEKVQSLILSVGRDYERVVIKPEVRSIIRGLTSQVEAKALYTSGRGELQQRLKDDLSEAFGRSMVRIDLELIWRPWPITVPQGEPGLLRTTHIPCTDSQRRDSREREMPNGPRERGTTRHVPRKSTQALFATRRHSARGESSSKMCCSSLSSFPTN